MLCVCAMWPHLSIIVTFCVVMSVPVTPPFHWGWGGGRSESGRIVNRCTNVNLVRIPQGTQWVRLQHYGAPEANAFNASQDLHRNECSAEQNTHALAGHAQADSSGSDNSRCRRPGVLRYRRSCGRERRHNGTRMSARAVTLHRAQYLLSLQVLVRVGVGGGGGIYTRIAPIRNQTKQKKSSKSAVPSVKPLLTYVAFYHKFVRVVRSATQAVNLLLLFPATHVCFSLCIVSEDPR